MQAKPMTVTDFDDWLQQLTRIDNRYEFIAGEIVEVPNNAHSSKIASLISYFLLAYIMKHDIGHVTGEGGGYQVNNERYAPDVAFISYEKQPQLAKVGHNPNPPDLAVEVVSSDDKAENSRLTIKLSNYLAVGTTVWIVRPETKIIEVHEPGKGGKIYTTGETITRMQILPNFTINVDDVLKD